MSDFTPHSVTDQDIRDALHNLGAYGAGQAIQRDRVLGELQILTGTRLTVRQLKLIAAPTRSPEALREHPEQAILTGPNGLYLPASRTLPEDLDHCAEFLDVNLGNIREQIRNLHSAADAIRNPAPGLFDHLEDSEEDAA